MIKRALAPLAAGLFAIGGLNSCTADRGQVTFVDVGAAASIDRPTLAGSTTKESILESSTGGVALFDYDNDGDVDIFIVNGPGPEMAADGGEPRAALYRNDGDWHFVEIGRAAGVDRAGWGMGAVAADYNGDGWVDLLVTAYGGNALYRNRGDGTFTDVAVATGAVGQGWSTGAVFADFDGDDDLDLYVAHYIDEPPDRASGAGRTCQWRGLAVFCGPAGLLASVDRYYRNEGAAAGWVFTQVDLPGNVEPGYGFGVLAGDFDGDGDSDIYVANDAGANALYRNDGKGFSETAVAAGVAYSGDGRKQAGMGIAGGDYDGDGDIDLFATNFSHDNNTLYRNDGQGLFHDASFAAGLGALSLGQLGWGTSFFDFDNDGDDDLFIANGHVYPQVDGAGLGTSYAQANQLFANLGNGRFTEISDRAGPGLQVQKSSRGMAAGDLDDDGDIDLVIVNIDDSPTVLRNDGGNGGNWLQVRLRQDGANTRAVGARVALQRGQRLQLRQVRAGTGYLSQGDMRLHFGLQDDAGVEELIVTWPDGVEDRFAGLGANQVVEIRRGQGVVVVSP